MMNFPRYIPGATSKVADRRVVGKEDDECGIGYLAQHDLFDQIPALLGDIMTPDYTSISRYACHHLRYHEQKECETADSQTGR
jgi:hypothetical protein